MNAKSIRALWLEYKVACQFAKTWARIEDVLDLARRRKANGSPRNDDDEVEPYTNSSGSPAHWMTQVDIPEWFERDELGMGSATNYFDTLAGLKAANKRRAVYYLLGLQQLAVKQC